MTIFTIFIVLSYLLFTNPFINFTASEDAVFIVFKSTSSAINKEHEYYERTKIKTFRLFTFK
jgi:hypothetical protein